MPPATMTIDGFIDRAGRLYSLPAVAVEVLRLTEHPKVDTAGLKQCIENDPALTTKILKVVNSSLFGLSREVGDLNQALALLGTEPLKLLVLGFSLPERLFANIAGDVLTGYWRHTLTKAIAAREICQSVWQEPGDQAFLAGLLSDVGFLVLVSDLGETYVRFAQQVEAENGQLLPLEADVLGFDHVTLSAKLLEAWGLPSVLTAAIAAPHEVDALQRLPEGEAPLAQVLHLAELLATLVADHRICVLPELLDAGRTYRGITRGQVSELVACLETKVQALAEVLSVELPDGLDYCEVLSQAHARLSEAAAQAVPLLVGRMADETTKSEALQDASRELAEANAQLADTVPFADIVPRQSPSEEVGVQPPATNSELRELKSDTGLHSKQGSRSTAADDVDPGLVGRLDAAVARCRQDRQELSLLMAQVDRFDEQIISRGESGQQHIVDLLDVACRTLDHPEVAPVLVRDACYAVLLADCDRRLAVELGGQLRRTVQILVDRQSPGAASTVTLSVGVATVALPPKNFDVRRLIEAAERCLYGAQAGGGNGVKSIEI